MTQVTQVTKPGILQIGPYPAWDQEPLDAAFDVHRYFEVADKEAFLREVGPSIRGIATRGELGAGRAMIEALGPEGMLINISRAPNIDEEALLEALESGALGSAALDVFEGEPKLDPRFLKLENVLLQPYHASGTVETRKAMGRLVRENLSAHFAGAPLPTPVL